jgi:hypothetical protein
MYAFRNKASFYCEELLASRLTPKLQDNPLSAIHDCLFNLFTTTLHIGSLYSIRNMGTRRAVVTGTHLSQTVLGFENEVNEEQMGRTYRMYIKLVLCLTSFNHEELSNSTKNKSAKYMLRIYLNKITRQPSRKLKMSGKLQCSVSVRIILGICFGLHAVLHHLPCVFISRAGV